MGRGDRENGCKRPRGRKQDGLGTCPHSSGRPSPPRIVLHAANVLRATEIRERGHETPTVRWHPPEDGAQLAVAHFKTGGPVYNDALSRLGNTQGPLLLMLPTDLAAALRQELDGCEGLRVRWEAVADSTLLALLHRDAANGCQWDTLAPHLTGRHVYMAAPPHGGYPRGTPARRGTTSSPPSTTTGFSPTTRGERSSGRRSAGTTGAASPPACWRSGTPSDRGGTTSGSAISTLGRRPPTSYTPADSAGNATRCLPQRRQAPTGARGAPRWPRAPGPNLPRARAGARRRRPCTGASRGHGPPHTNARAPRALPFCGSTCTCGTPHPLRTCRTCSRPDPHPSPPFAEPAVPCHADTGDWPGHARARRQAQEATVRGLVADAVAEAHEAHAAARRDPTGSARAFLNETALRAVRALNRAGAPTLLPAMHRIVNAIQPGVIGPEAALYGHSMEWRESNRSGQPLSMGDTLRLTGAASAMSLRSSAPALLHALRMRYPGDTALYLNQARATYPGGVSELDAVLHLLHPPDEDLVAGEITVFVEGAHKAPARPRPTNPLYDGTRPTPPYAIVCEAFPREPAWCPALPPATHAPRGWANQDLSPPLSRTRSAHHRGQVLWQERPGTPLLLLVVATRGDPERVLGITPTHLYGAALVPRPPPPGARGAGQGTHLPADTGGHRCYGGPPSAAPPGSTRRPPGAQGPEPRPRLGAVA